MTILALSSLITALISSLLFASSPVTLGVWIMLIAIAGSLTIAACTSAWLAMFTFLIYVGGLLVMFAYFTATAPNQIHNFYPMMKFSLIMFTLMSLTFWSPSLLTPPQNEIFLIMDTMNAPFFLFLVLLLLLTLIATVKVTQVNQGPLRKFHA
uniref:NADH dehydrogenase subunit 6 n=1 Tax=Orbinia latreillii TaxID=195264 RepID=Q1X8Y8_9ANNE|nr:NADH dehydrogenase subunit 6 [Orbinia latreillii]AAX50143.1 NADH dehydrogenase subunit 6 [Orbinia latreillii]